MNYTEFSFSTGVTFKNVFFSEEQELLERVQFFLKTRLGILIMVLISHMFCPFLHRESGFGKISTIYCIAYMTQRHIVSIPSRSIKSMITWLKNQQVNDS